MLLLCVCVCFYSSSFHVNILPMLNEAPGGASLIHHELISLSHQQTVSRFLWQMLSHLFGLGVGSALCERSSKTIKLSHSVRPPF